MAARSSTCMHDQPHGLQLSQSKGPTSGSLQSDGSPHPLAKHVVLLELHEASSQGGAPHILQDAGWALLQTHDRPLLQGRNHNRL